MDRVEVLFRKTGLLRSAPLETADPPPLSAISSDDAVPTITEIVVRGVEWRDQESMRLADRAATLLTGGSVVVGVGTAAAFGSAAATASRAFLLVALLAFMLLALVTILVLRPRVMPRQTGYAVDRPWGDPITLQREHHRYLRQRADVLDAATRDNARLVEVAGMLLALETLMLTTAIVVQWL